MSSSNIPSHTRKCPDCGGGLSDVVVGEPVVMRSPGLRYQIPSQSNGLWAKMNERIIEGQIDTLMCEGCRRIFFYGRPSV